MIEQTLKKMAARLTQEEQKRQALQFAGLGAASVPTVSAVRNLITEGRAIPKGVSPVRWGAGQLATGAALFGALPAVRHLIERGSQEQAEERLRRKRISQGLKEYYAARMEEPMTQVKSAGVNLTSRDNRTPFVGGTQFPTEGSKATAKKLHAASAGKAEVGPAPLMGELDKTKMTPLSSITPKMPSAKGSLPKIGGVMDNRIVKDPLVQYLKKHAQALETNAEALSTQMLEPPKQSKDSDFQGTPAEKKKQEEEELLKSLFTHYPTEKLQK